MIKYPYSHAVVAILVSLVTLSPTAGVAIYWMRELRDLEKGYNWNCHFFDWKGFLWPTLTVGPFALLELYLKYQYLLGMIK